MFVGSAASPGNNRASAATTSLQWRVAVAASGTFATPPLRMIGMGKLAVWVRQTGGVVAGFVDLINQGRLGDSDLLYDRLAIAVIGQPVRRAYIPLTTRAVYVSFTNQDPANAVQFDVYLSGTP